MEGYEVCLKKGRGKVKESKGWAGGRLALWKDGVWSCLSQHSPPQAETFFC